MPRTPKYSSLDSLAGAAGRLDRSLDFDEMLEIAREDALVVKYGRSRQRDNDQHFGSQQHPESFGKRAK